MSERSRSTYTGPGGRTERRRAQGREAQRRFRMRKDQTIQDLQERNERLQQIVEAMSSTFISFGDRLWDSGLLHGNESLTNELQSCMHTFLDLAREAQSESEDAATAAANLEDDTEADLDAARTAAMGPPFLHRRFSVPVSTAGSSEATTFHASSGRTGRAVTLRRTLSYPPQRIAEEADDESAAVQGVGGTSTDTSGAGNSSSISSPLPAQVLRMPTLNPLMAEDYAANNVFPDPRGSLSLRLVISGLRNAYHGVEMLRGGHVDDPYGQWALRLMRFALLHVSYEAIRNTISKVLWKLEREQDEEVEAVAGSELPLEHKRTKLASIFRQSPAQDELGKRIRHDMLREGIDPVVDIADAVEVEQYYREKGIRCVSEDRREMEVYTASPPSSPGGIGMGGCANEVWRQVASIDVARLVQELIDTSVCMGNMLGFPRDKLDTAIARSTVSMTTPMLLTA